MKVQQPPPPVSTLDLVNFLQGKFPIYPSEEEVPSLVNVFLQAADVGTTLLDNFCKDLKTAPCIEDTLLLIFVQGFQTGRQFEFNRQNHEP